MSAIPSGPANTQIIAKNSFWYGIETVSDLVLTAFTSIIIARKVGPIRIGYFLYVWWMVGIVGTMGLLGIPAATRKYVGEYFGRRRMGIAKTVFYKTLLIQTGIAAAITLATSVAFWVWGDREHRAMSLLMVGSIFPYMVDSISAAANRGLEDLRANVPASLVATGTYVIAVFLSLYLGWDLLGIAAGLLLMRVLGLPVRLIPLMRRLKRHEAEPLEQALSKRIFVFSGQSLVLMALGLIVWNRSEMIVLKNFCADIRQVAFYSVAFNITERLLVFSQIFGSATGATIMVQYGRDPARLRAMAGTAVRYLALIALPVHLGLAAIAAPVMWIIYGHKYMEAAPVLALAACMGIPKAFYPPVQALLMSWDRQDVLIRWGIVSAVVNIGLDFALIPKYGAIGAAVANGVSQTFAVGVLWLAAFNLLKIRLPIKGVVRTAAVSGCMALLVHGGVFRFSAIPAAAIGVVMGVVLYLVGLRVSRVLGGEDRERMLQLKRYVPTIVRRVFDVSLNWLIPAPVAE
ncbi:MAG: polysaccharide biosynthesis C-terminal domain-containing protein [Candidatus Acidiferrales bacterium]